MILRNPVLVEQIGSAHVLTVAFGKTPPEFRGQYGGKRLEKGLFVLGPFLSLLLVLDDSAADFEIGQHLGSGLRNEPPPCGPRGAIP